MTALAPTLQAFFTDRLALQRQASGHTVAAYRDALRMLIVYAAQHAGKAPSRLDIADLDAQTVGAFLNHLENERGNSARTRNARLAAIHSLFGYAAVRHPEHAADILDIVRRAPKPLLIHCKSGADRAGLVAGDDWVRRCGKYRALWVDWTICSGGD